MLKSVDFFRRVIQQIKRGWMALGPGRLCDRDDDSDDDEEEEACGAYDSVTVLAR